MSDKICAIHQPNFFPWMGYFDKIKRCDVFVVLDDVQLPKKGGTWSNRVYMKIQGEKKWVTAPINRPSGLQNIDTVMFQNTNWRTKLTKTIQANYSKAPHYNTYKDFIIELINYPSNNVVEYNLNAISKICDLLSINFKDKIVLSSTFKLESQSNQLLIDLTKKVNCNTYMAGGGAEGYQVIDLFKDQNINFICQSFSHPNYNQIGENEFIKGLSIIDYIFNQGKEYDWE